MNRWRLFVFNFLSSFIFSRARKVDGGGMHAWNQDEMELKMNEWMYVCMRACKHAERWQGHTYVMIKKSQIILVSRKRFRLRAYPQF